MGNEEMGNGKWENEKMKIWTGNGRRLLLSSTCTCT